MLDAATGVQPTVERLLHLFGTIRGEPIDPNKGIYKAELIIEKPSDRGRPREARHARSAGGELPRPLRHARLLAAHLRSLEYLIKNNLREKGEIQLTAAQEHLRQQTDKYWVVVTRRASATTPASRTA